MDFVDNLKKYSNVKTVSIALPTSIFNNAPTPQLESYLVGQIARAAVVFNVCEIILFEENGGERDYKEDPESRAQRLVKLFEYAECPQYLRKRIFPLEPDLKYAGLINPLEAQHHLRTSQLDCPYREGITTKHLTIEHHRSQKEWTEVNIGLNKPVRVSGFQKLNARVTLKVDPHDLKKLQAMLGQTMQDLPEAQIVPPVEPVEKLNLYWGYYVRRAANLSESIRQNVFIPEKKKFYDLIIGTSERGQCIDELTIRKDNNPKKDDGKDGGEAKKARVDFKHILVVFGGIKGLEFSASCDQELKNCTNVASLFDYYVNTCPNQGSTTIRTEEAILITMSALRPRLNL